MTQARLHTADGSYVTTVRHPHFRTPPDALVWGSRTFVRWPVRSAIPVYREAFTVAIVEPHEPEEGVEPVEA